MAVRRDPVKEARLVTRDLHVRLGQELRDARRIAGLSQAAVGAACGMSHAQVGRIERGDLRALSFAQANGVAAAVGLRIVVRTYPGGDATRDAGQLRLLDRFRRLLPPAARWETEVPLPIPGDPRAWDGRVTLGGRRAGCEAETRLGDVQAVDRRIARKERDGAVDLVILVVADTKANRRVLRDHREALRSRFPLDGHAVIAALRAGRLPDASGIVLV